MIPLFIDINGRRLFCVRFCPNEGSTRQRILIAPPFGEELNKCRKLLAMTCRRLAEAGCDVLLPDLYGTGDSEGELHEAYWTEWLDDWAALDRWHGALVPNVGRAYLALRSGALILAGAAPAMDVLAGAHVLLWQPVRQGARFFEQFLRLRVMSARLTGSPLTIKDLEAELMAEGFVEVAGYKVSRAFVADFRRATLDAQHLAHVARVAIVECSPSPGGQLSMPVVKLAEELRQAGVDCTAVVEACEQFWLTQEITAPELLARNSVGHLVAAEA